MPGLPFWFVKLWRDGERLEHGKTGEIGVEILLHGELKQRHANRVGVAAAR